MVWPDLVLNFIPCMMVQCSMNDRLESKVMMQLEHRLLCLSWMSCFGGFGTFLSKTRSDGFVAGPLAAAATDATGFGSEDFFSKSLSLRTWDS